MINKAVIRKHNNGGFTVIEVLVAMFIIGLIIPGVINLLSVVERINSANSKQTVAVALTVAKMEEIKNAAFIDITTSNGKEIKGIYTLSWQITKGIDTAVLLVNNTWMLSGKQQSFALRTITIPE